MPTQIAPHNYTGAGHPVHSYKGHSNVSNSTLYRCTKDRRHRSTYNQARNAKWYCTHCGAPLEERQEKIKYLHQLARDLGIKVNK